MKWLVLERLEHMLSTPICTYNRITILIIFVFLTCDCLRVKLHFSFLRVRMPFHTLFNYRRHYTFAICLSKVSPLSNTPSILQSFRLVWGSDKLTIRRLLQSPIESNQASFSFFPRGWTYGNSIFLQLLLDLAACHLIIFLHLLINESFCFLRQLFRSSRTR